MSPDLVQRSRLSHYQTTALRIANLHSFTDLLLISLQEVARKCKLSIAEAKDIYDTLSEEQASLYIPTLAEREADHDDVCSTGDLRLDEALGGGIRTGMVWEVVGESAAGKSQFALQLSLFAQTSPDVGGLSASTCYLTTSSRLPTARLLQILQSNVGVLFSAGLEHIHTVSTPTVPVLQNVLTTLLPQFIEEKASKPLEKPVKLLVIDALAELFHSSNTTTRSTLIERAQQLYAISSTLHALASVHRIAVLIINEVVDRFEKGSNGSLDDELFYDDKSRWFNTCNSISGENRKEATLGLVWANQVNARIMLSRTGRRRYLDATHIEKKKRRPSLLSEETTQVTSVLGEDDSSTLIRRLSLIFSPISASESLDYVITQKGLCIIQADGGLPQPANQRFRFSWDNREDTDRFRGRTARVEALSNLSGHSDTTWGKAANPLYADDDEWEKYWDKDEEFTSVDWDALERSLTQPSS